MIPQDPEKSRLKAIVSQMRAESISYADAVKQFELQFILEVLAHHGGNQCQAATALGVHRNTLNRKLAEYGIDSARFRRGLKKPPTSTTSGSPSEVPVRYGSGGIQVIRNR